MIDLKESKNIFFIGIGGISMSSIAEILTYLGHKVSGSNNVENQMTNVLKNDGYDIRIGHSKENINDSLDLIVYTSSISEDNEELVKARELNIPCVKREYILGELMKLYKSPICISGTHGKTTTSSMISEMFIKADLDPTISVGGVIKTINSNTRIGKDNYFINESCEYRNAFLSFYPESAVILNIEADHLDFFKDINDIRNSFKTFASKIPENGTLVINNNITALKEITDGLKCNIITYGNMTANLKATEIVYDMNGLPTFDVIYNDEKFVSLSLKVPGYHNVSNSLAAAAIGIAYNIPADKIKEGIEAFVGTERRLELKGEFNGAKVYDDYAHHPTEITASITSLNAIPHNKLYVVFQPHTYTRTASLLDDFALALSKADKLIIADIYAARETNTVNIHPEDLVEKIKEFNKNVIYLKSFNEIEKHLKNVCIKGDIVAIMGAGDIEKVCDMLLK